MCIHQCDTGISIWYNHARPTPYPKPSQEHEEVEIRSEDNSPSSDNEENSEENIDVPAPNTDSDDESVNAPSPLPLSDLLDLELREYIDIYGNIYTIDVPMHYRYLSSLRESSQ